MVKSSRTSNEESLNPYALKAYPNNMTRNRGTLVTGIVLTILGILGILSPTIESQLQWESLPPYCKIHPCLQAPDSLIGFVWLLGIGLFAFGLILIARSSEVSPITRSETT